MFYFIISGNITFCFSEIKPYYVENSEIFLWIFSESHLPEILFFLIFNLQYPLNSVVADYVKT